jgi:hypothetical protein
MATLIYGIEELKWEGQADTPITQIQDENWFANEEKMAWSQEEKSYPCDTPIGVISGDERNRSISLGTKPVALMGDTPDWGVMTGGIKKIQPTRMTFVPTPWKNLPPRTLPELPVSQDSWILIKEKRVKKPIRQLKGHKKIEEYLSPRPTPEKRQNNHFT